MKKVYTIFLVLTLALLSNTAFAQMNLLYVGNITAAPEDSLLVGFLEDAGYTVTDITDSEFTAYVTPEQYADYDVIFISEVVGSGNTVAFRTAGYPIPCVTTEGYVVRVGRWDWIEDNTTQFLQIAAADIDAGLGSFIIDDNQNFITKYYPVESEVPWTTKEDLAETGNEAGVTGFQLENTMSEAIQLAHFNNTAMEPFPSIWAIPAGSSVTHPGNSDGIPNNIVVMGMHNNGLRPNYATDEYHDLIIRSLQWVTDNPLSVDFVEEKGNDLSIMPNPSSGVVNLSFAINTSGKVQIDIYDITGKRMETIESGYLGAGNNTLTLDLTDMSNGQYIVRLKTFDNVLTRKVLKTQ